MPELPEVETVRRGLALRMEGRRITNLALNRADLRTPLPLGLRARVEGRREAVERARVTELGLDDDALDAQTRYEQLLRRESGLRPRPFLFARRQASDATDPIRQRRCLQHDDDTLADRDPGALCAGEPLPARFSLLGYAFTVTPGRDEDGRDDDRESRKHQGVERLTRWTRRHRAQDSRDTGWSW